jgi:hypothetical protein
MSVFIGWTPSNVLKWTGHNEPAMIVTSLIAPVGAEQREENPGNNGDGMTGRTPPAPDPAQGGAHRDSGEIRGGQPPASRSEPPGLTGTPW